MTPLRPPSATWGGSNRLISKVWSRYCTPRKSSVEKCTSTGVSSFQNSRLPGVKSIAVHASGNEVRMMLATIDAVCTPTLNRSKSVTQRHSRAEHEHVLNFVCVLRPPLEHDQPGLAQRVDQGSLVRLDRSAGALQLGEERLLEFLMPEEPIGLTVRLAEPIT